MNRKYWLAWRNCWSSALNELSVASLSLTIGGAALLLVVFGDWFHNDDDDDQTPGGGLMQPVAVPT